MNRRSFCRGAAAALLGLALPRPADAAEVAVSIWAPEGEVVAWPDRRLAELRLPGQAPIAFPNATVSIGRARVHVAGRTASRTLVAWASRTSRSGGIGLVTRTGDPRRPRTLAILPTRLSVGGEPPREIRSAARKLL